LKSIASAPGKIILFGEHFVVHGTKAILAAIDKRVTVTSTITEASYVDGEHNARRSSSTLKINSQLGTFEIPLYSYYNDFVKDGINIQWLGSQSRYGPESFATHQSIIKSEFMPFVYLVAKLSHMTDERHIVTEPLLHPNGLEITIDSDIPIGVGLGSSSACCVAAAASLYALFCEKDGGAKLKFSQENETKDILSLAKEAERTIFPDTSGADCTVCTYGGMIEYPSIEKIGNTFDLNLLIANSMIPHNTKNSVEKVNKFKENDEERFSKLCDLENGLINEVIVAMKNNDAATFGLKMSENQKYLEEIQVSNETINGMISSLKEISLGTKITGAGDGGCVIALIKDEDMDKVPALLPKDKECFSAKIDTKGVEWKIEK
jgi:mevalonate kinase